MAEETLFTKIINGDIPADILYEDDQCICIRDIQPQAPTHVLVIPRKPIPKLAEASQDDKALLGHLMLAVGDIARKLGAGQTVFHLHLHILANKTFEEGSLGMH